MKELRRRSSEGYVLYVHARTRIRTPTAPRRDRAVNPLTKERVL